MSINLCVIFISMACSIKKVIFSLYNFIHEIRVYVCVVAETLFGPKSKRRFIFKFISSHHQFLTMTNSFFVAVMVAEKGSRYTCSSFVVNENFGNCVR